MKIDTIFSVDQTNLSIIMQQCKSSLCDSTSLSYPRATRCGGDIVMLLWFHPCLSVSHLNLVNMIETKPLCVSSSNLADMLIMT